MINILHLRDTYEVGGPGKTILETISHIDRSRFRMHLGVFLTRNETEDTPFIREARTRGICLHTIRSYNQYDPRVLLSIRELIGKLNIDILHTHESKSDILGFLVSKICSVRTVTTLHGWIENTFRQRMYTALDKFIVRRFDQIIVVSDLMKETMIREGIRPEAVNRLYNSIVVEKYQRDSSCSDRPLRAAIGKRFIGPVVATVGRLSLEKGHADFIRAASIVLSRGQRADFLLVGDGPERKRLEGLIHELGVASNVFLTGYQKDPWRFFNEIDLMVLPSYTEGLPNVVLESLMMEVPVIATHVGGTPEIIENGRTGLLVEPGRPERIAESILYLLEHPERMKEMALRGRSFVQEHFNFRERTSRLEKIYEETFRTKGH